MATCYETPVSESSKGHRVRLIPIYSKQRNYLKIIKVSPMMKQFRKNKTNHIIIIHAVSQGYIHKHSN